jgi:hypothetical protein
MLVDPKPCRRCSAAKPAAVPAVDQHAAVKRQVEEAADDDREIPLPVALHEIGHVLTNFCVSGEKLLEVIARPDSGSSWHESPEHPDDDEITRRSRYRRALVGILAGAEVDKRNGGAWNGLSWLVSRHDADVADRMLAAIAHPNQGHDEALAPLREIAAMAVHDAWPLINELGVWLQAAGRLPGPVLTKFLESNPAALSLRSYFSAAFSRRGGGLMSTPTGFDKEPAGTAISKPAG